MADEANTQVAAEDTQVKGAPAGVTQKDLDAGQSSGGNPAPVVSNEPPVKQETAEEKTAREATEKEAADKKVADEAVAKEAADKAEADKKAEDEASTKEYPVYNDEAADAVVAILKESGVTPAEADTFFRSAVESGKLEDIDSAKLIEKVGKEKANLILIGVKDYYNRNTEGVKKVVEEVHKATGGEEGFATVKTWALEKEKTDPKFKAELDEYRGMLNGTPTQARLAAQELVKAFNADPKTKSLSVTITHGDSTTSGALDLGYISRADYVTALKVADSKGDATEVARLNARRKASVTQERQGVRS